MGRSAFRRQRRVVGLVGFFAEFSEVIERCTVDEGDVVAHFICLAQDSGSSATGMVKSLPSKPSKTSSLKDSQAADSTVFLTASRSPRPGCEYLVLARLHADVQKCRQLSDRFLRRR